MYKQIILFVGILLTTQAYAQNAKLDYPELQVTPLASARIKMEAGAEKRLKFYSNLPLQLSAISTLTAGVLQMGDVDETKDIDKNSAKLAILIGGGWLAINSYINMRYRPYARAYRKISRLPKKSMRDKLTLERMAEEEINYLGKLGNRIKWLSMFTNIGASAYVISKSKSGSKAKVVGGLSALLAMAPLLFENRWAIIDREQRNYKKKIYGPIVSTGLIQDPGTKGIVPGAFLTLNF